ncbi:hypothetical protein [Mycetocola reblochoni]|uniref:histidine kinase n=1 Tax=Mycetocola reblochoni TaxID=331618 RepID=A0A3L6ZJW1_9MICO|nr:hypothetical protein [Mycetocola reblochoni]RLP67975.1 hypothetical protein D9V30_11755 [Mycetocola reblochoni]
MAHLRGLGIEVTVGVPSGIQVSHSVETTLVHLLTECTTNVLTHAPQAALVDIQFMVGESRVDVRFRNDSASPVREAGSNRDRGYGLRPMTERVELLGGALSAQRDGGSWLVQASLPRA